MWAVFGPGTEDYPGEYVARLWRTLPRPEPTDMLLRAATLDELRHQLPPGLVLLARCEQDDENLIETWL
jgi:hypothetical protein